jgi:hypothetical protein
MNDKMKSHAIRRSREPRPRKQKPETRSRAGSQTETSPHERPPNLTGGQGRERERTDGKAKSSVLRLDHMQGKPKNASWEARRTVVATQLKKPNHPQGALAENKHSCLN